MKTTSLRILAAGLVLCASAAQAGPILYAGDLTNGEVQTGTVLNDSIRSLDQYQYWRFDAAAGDRIEVVARRLERNHDPVMRIWFGLFSDTLDLGRARYFADDEIRTPGPFGDPRERFLAEAGTYTIGIFDHSAARSRCDGLCDYRVSVLGSTVSVPEPASLALMGLGLLSLGMLRKRRRSQLEL